MFTAPGMAALISRMERRSEAIAPAVERAISVKYWKPRLEIAATKTIRALWHREFDLGKRTLYERLTPVMVATLSGELLAGPITRFVMSAPPVEPTGWTGGSGSGPTGTGGESGGPVEKARETVMNTARKFRDPATWAGTAADVEVQAVRDGILEWVQTEKRKEMQEGGRDHGLTDEQIADRLEWALGLRGRPGDYTDHMAEVTKDLAARINEWLTGQAEGETRTPEGGTPSGDGTPGVVTWHGEGRPTLPPEVAGVWLAAVLESWQKLVAEGLPGRLEFELKKAWGGVGAAELNLT